MNQGSSFILIGTYPERLIRNIKDGTQNKNNKKKKIKLIMNRTCDGFQRFRLIRAP
jgi:hypothetical protein